MHKIISLQAENVKRLKAVHIEPDGNVVVLTGKNEQGKSSVLDSIWMALGGARNIPAKAVRDGAIEAKAVVELGGDSTLTVTRIVKVDGKTELRVIDGDGVKLKSPQKILDQLVGKITFDPLEFTRLAPAKRITALQEVAGVDLSTVDGKIAALLDSRRDVNRDLEQAQGAAATMQSHDDAPDQMPSIQDIVNQLETAKSAVQQHQSLGERKTELVELCKRYREQIKDAEAEIEEVERLLSGCTIDETETKASDLQEQLKHVEANAQKYRDNAQHATATEHIENLQAEVDDQTESIEDLRTERTKTMNDAEWPVDGMGFADGDISVNGIPFSDCSSAQALKISLLMAIKTNPDLRVCFIRDGSLLDSDSMATVAEIANENDFQVWIERVDDDQETAVVLTDGMIQA